MTQVEKEQIAAVARTLAEHARLMNVDAIAIEASSDGSVIVRAERGAFTEWTEAALADNAAEVIERRMP